MSEKTSDPNVITSFIDRSGLEWLNVLNIEVIQGNEVWRFILLLIGIIATLTAGKVVQYLIGRYAQMHRGRFGENVWGIFIESLAKPAYVAVFAWGLNLCKYSLYFDEEQGIRPVFLDGWTKTAQVVGSIAIAYALYKLVDVIEFYLNKVAAKTHNRLDDMLVPVLRKSLRVTIAIVAVLVIAESVVGADRIKSLILGAGIGGLAIALAAKDTIANFFGSVTIFADRPFQIGDLVKIDNYFGPVEEVGFRSTKIRTLDGSQIIIPNSVLTNTTIENVGRRPYIRRTSGITITYDTGSKKTALAVDVIKEILSGIKEINSNPDTPFRVYFSDFNDSSLNIYMSYWVYPPDYWLYMQINEKVNTEIQIRFEQEGIEFAFPTRTVYVKNDDQ